jgi:hypothetical protein
VRAGAGGREVAGMSSQRNALADVLRPSKAALDPETLRRRPSPLDLIATVARNGHAKSEDPGLPDDDRLDHTIVVSVGGTTELELGTGPLHPSANLIVEWDAIENWLELEIGAFPCSPRIEGSKLPLTCSSRSRSSSRRGLSSWSASVPKS